MRTVPFNFIKRKYRLESEKSRLVRLSTHYLGDRGVGNYVYTKVVVVLTIKLRKRLFAFFI
jgi:hypothetical protein